MSEQDDHTIRFPYQVQKSTRLRPDRRTWASRAAIAFVVGFALCYALFFIPLPYYAFGPGTAENIGPMVSVQQGDTAEKGSFMLTAVYVSKANVALYVKTKLFGGDLYKSSAVRQNGESDKEYDERQQYVMLTSQSTAMQAAYTKAGVPFHISQDGVAILQTLPGMPAEALLQAGDVVLTVEGQPIPEAAVMTGILQKKHAGDEVTLTYRRGTDEHTAALKLATLTKQQPTDPDRAGIGVVPGNLQSVKADDPAKQLSVKAGDIGGPSAGLMFSLEMYNRLTPGDLSKGYRIAGTGTITPDGNVGVIGGIRYKTAAASGQGADIFFAPKDLVPGPGDRFQKIPNASDAIDEAKKIRSKMKVVPVGTLQDALDYLAALPPQAA